MAQIQRDQPSLAELIEAGGLQRAIRARQIPPPVLARITSELRGSFTALPRRQGLRFRSSSTAEDIEGFNGAGLYRSSTGFLRPRLLLLPKKRRQTAAWALKRTWASYWSSVAFEERRLAHVDHLSGNMGVLVHPRLDDRWERANGVATVIFDVRGEGGPVVTLEVNAQLGAESVTNPSAESAATPETVRVQGDPTQPTITRLTWS